MLGRLASYLADHVRLPVEIRLNVNRRTLISYRLQPKPKPGLRLSVHRMFLNAPEEVFAAIALWLNGEETDESRAQLRRWMNEQSAQRAQEVATRQTVSANSNIGADAKTYAQPGGGAGVQLLLFEDRAGDEPDDSNDQWAADDYEFDEEALPAGRQRRELPRPPEKLHTKGRYYNLRELADRLNYQYFEGKCPVYVTWSMAPAARLHPDSRGYHTESSNTEGGGARRRRRSRSILFGSYSEKEHTVRVHPRLDAPDVPQWFVEFIIYHEMLHKWSPPKILPSGRRDIHTREFRHLERRFPRYREAQMFERNLMNRLD